MLKPDVTARSMTIAAFKSRLSRYPDDVATLLIHAAARGIPLHGASVPQPVVTGRAFSPRLFGVVVILRHPAAL